MKLKQGQNVPLAEGEVTVRISGLGADHVVHAFVLGTDGIILKGSRPVFYGNARDSGLVMRGISGPVTRLIARPSELPEEASRIVICLTSWAGIIRAPGDDALEVGDGSQKWSADIPFTGQYERSLLLGEIYRRSGTWRFRYLLQGYMRGLSAVNEAFGTNLEDISPVTMARPEEKAA